MNEPDIPPPGGLQPPVPETHDERETVGPLISEAEQALLAQCRAGDAQAFHGLLRPHLGSLLALARRLVGDRHSAEDLVQETLVRAFRGIGQFRGDASVRTWLFRILIRLSTEPRRFGHGRRPQALPDVEIPSAVGPWPEHDAASRELEDRVREGIERLPARQRTAVHLRAVEGMDYAAIAAVLGCSNAAARMLVLAARQTLSRRLGGWLQP